MPARWLPYLPAVSCVFDNNDIRGLVERWRRAELNGDSDEVAAVLATDFIGVGPMGWVRTKAQWVEKYRSGTVSNDTFDLDDLTVIPLGRDSAVVVTHQTQVGTNGTVPTTGQFRFSLTIGADVLIHSIHVTRILEHPR